MSSDSSRPRDLSCPRRRELCDVICPSGSECSTSLPGRQAAHNNRQTGACLPQAGSHTVCSIVKLKLAKCKVPAIPITSAGKLAPLLRHRRRNVCSIWQPACTSLRPAGSQRRVAWTFCVLPKTRMSCRHRGIDLHLNFSHHSRNQHSDSASCWPHRWCEGNIAGHCARSSGCPALS
jgi:hypothetical protein